MMPRAEIDQEFKCACVFQIDLKWHNGLYHQQAVTFTDFTSLLVHNKQHTQLVQSCSNTEKNCTALRRNSKKKLNNIFLFLKTC